MKIWEVVISAKYPDGIRCALVAIESRSKKRVLMDNHSPKGHHYHLDDKEFNYAFKNMDKLIEDFQSLVKVHFGVSL